MRRQSTEHRQRTTGHGTRSMEHGFTFIELIIAITITLLATAAVYGTYIVQQRSFTTQDQVAETNLSSKIAFNMIINDIRTAGFGYPEDDNPAINGETVEFSCSDNTGTNNSDTITIIGGLRQLARLENEAHVDDTTIMIDYLSTTETRFNLSNRNALTIDGVNFAVITNCSEIGNPAFCSGASTISLDRPLSVPFPAGSAVYLVEDITYQISAATGNNCNNAPSGTTTCLERTGGSSGTDTIAQNIDDLQFAYAVDTNDDGIIDDQNINTVIDPGDYINCSSIPTGANILAVRVNLLASTAKEDPTLEPSTKPYDSGITLENQPNAIGAGDHHRRRIWSMVVGVRN